MSLFLYEIFVNSHRVFHQDSAECNCINCMTDHKTHTRVSRQMLGKDKRESVIHTVIGKREPDEVGEQSPFNTYCNNIM